MVDAVQVVSAVAGFAPALALLFFTLRDYTFPTVKQPFFDDRKVFAFFALGIVLGMVLFAFELYGQTMSSEETLIALVLGFAVMEELMKLVVLNFPRFQRKVDTAFYGLSMGLGISATFTFATIYTTALEFGEPTLLELAAIAMFGVPLVFMHGSTTALIGVGVARGEVKAYLAEALLIHLAYSLIMVPFFIVAYPLNLLALVAATAVAVYGYAKVHRLSLPVLIQDAKKLKKK